MTSQRVERTWIRTGGYGRFRGEWVNRVRKYAKFGVFYAKIVQMTPQRLRRESLRLQKFSVTNREPLRLQKFLVTNTVLSLPFSQQIQFTLIVNVVKLNPLSPKSDQHQISHCNINSL